MLIACKETVWKLTEKWQSWISLNGKPPLRCVIGVKHSLYRFQRHLPLFFSSHFFLLFFFFPPKKKGVNKSFALLSISLRSSNPLDFYVSLKDDGTKELTKEEIRNRVVSAVCVTIHKIETRADQLCLRVVRKFKNAHQAIKWGVTTRANLWIVLINRP